MPASHLSVFYRRDALPAPNQHRRSIEGYRHSSCIGETILASQQCILLDVRQLYSGLGFLPWQKLFLPGQWKKPWQKLAKTGKIKDTIN